MPTDIHQDKTPEQYADSSKAAVAIVQLQTQSIFVGKLMKFIGYLVFSFWYVLIGHGMLLEIIRTVTASNCTFTQ